MYDAIHAAPAPENAWDRHTSDQIERVVAKCLDCLNTRKTLNLGSGGLTYGLVDAIQLDLIPSALEHATRAIVADVHNIPIRTAAVEAVLCVGGVVNYVSLPEALAEIERVLRPDGILVLEYERLRTLQFAGTKKFDRHVSPEPTTYRGGGHLLWRYSDAYVMGTLRAHSFEVLQGTPFHLLTPLLLRLHVPSFVIAAAAKLDPLLRRTGVFARLSANHVVIAKRSLTIQSARPKPL